MAIDLYHYCRCCWGGLRWPLLKLALAIASALCLAVAATTRAADASADPVSIKAARREAALSASPKRRLPIAPKVQRYAERLIRQYDTNGDGVLQTEEWAKIQGDPSLIDVNGDGVITVQDMARYVARYGVSHRIHLAVPTQSGASLLAGMTPTAGGSLATDAVPYADGMVPLEAAYAAAEEMSEDDPSREGEPGIYGLEPRSLLSRDASPGTGKKLRPVSPWTQKFHVPLRTLPAGLPDWFRARDLDGDGQITLHEFAPEATRKDIEEFSRYDLDRDGVITPLEAAGLGGRSATGAASPVTVAPAVKSKRRP